MKLTEDLIKKLEVALDTRKKDGTPIWNDGDDIDVSVAGTFVSDKFIALTNRTKNPVVSSIPPNIDSQYTDHEEGT